MSRERPLLMSGPLVRAVLDGRKSQTRRIVKGGPWARVFRDAMTDHTGDPDYFCLRADGTGTVVRFPYGQVGDRLWVREAWGGDDMCGVAYRADHPDWRRFQGSGEQPDGPWRPSIH